jgi:lysophospholipase L1-like esterase
MNRGFILFVSAALCIMFVLSTAMVVEAQQTTRPTTGPSTQPFGRGARGRGGRGGPPVIQSVFLPLPQGQIDQSFLTKHQRNLDRAKQGNIRLLFMGDSITEGFYLYGPDQRGVWGKAVFEKSYLNKYGAADFGIGSDRVQNQIWRIQNGEMDGLTPEVVVLMLGTNNVGSNTDDDIIKGDAKVVDMIHEKSPKTVVLVIGVFPREQTPDRPNRLHIKTINEGLAKLDDGKLTRFMDITDKFLNPDGSMMEDVMRDPPSYLHPTEKGYQIWADAMQPTLDTLIKPNPGQ